MKLVKKRERKKKVTDEGKGQWMIRIYLMKEEKSHLRWKLIAKKGKGTSLQGLSIVSWHLLKLLTFNSFISSHQFIARIRKLAKCSTSKLD